MSDQLAIAPKAERPAPLTASDVNACIQAHFGAGGEKYAVLFEVRNGTAWKANRSVDAVVMSLWPSLGMELWGFEVKVSRHDWQRELANPGKASEVFGYFDRWFLVAPEHVVRHGEIPQPWGWFVPENGRLRQARPAQLNDKVKDVDRHFLGALLRRVAKTDDGFVQARVDTALREQHRQHEVEIERRALQKQGDLKRDAESWLKLRNLLKKQPDDWVYADDVVEAIRIVVKSGIGKSYGGIRDLQNAAKRVQEEIAKIAADLSIKLDEPKRRARK